MSPIERRKHRQQRLQDLLRLHFHNNQAALASRIGIAATLISRYLGGKGIGEDMRTKIEQNTGFLGWFDEVPPTHLGPINQANDMANGEYRVTPAPPRHHRPAGHMVEIAPASVTLNLPVECLTLWDQLQKLSPERQKIIKTLVALEAAQADVAELGINPAALDIRAPTIPPDKPKSRTPKAHDPA